jgi:fructoselysine-6-P-deglycase FrlB-like protein
VSTPPESHLQVEVAGQPDDWAGMAARLPGLAGLLPRRGERVAVVGCGTSFYMAQSYATLRERAGHGETDAFAASEARLDRDYDSVLAITRSGTTSEVVDLLRDLAEGPLATMVIVATPGTPVTELADHIVLLPEVDEQSVVQTRFATSVLALLRTSLGEDLSHAIADARAVLDEPEEQALAGLADAEQVTFVGRGWTVGLAEEAALKLRESAQFWSESYPAMEYRHGPISIAAPGRVVWALGEVPEGLREQVEATGARFVSRAIDPLAELVRVHRLCLLKARQQGLDPDSPRNLTRSVILTTPSLPPEPNAQA